MYSLKDEFEAMFLNSPDKIRAKKKLNELFDKYGESKRAIENGTEGAEHFEYILASAFADEVLAERRQAREAARERSVLQRNPAQEMRQDREDKKEQYLHRDLEEAALSQKKSKEETLVSYRKERENYIPKDITAKKEQVNILMDKYGEDLDTANMNMADYS